jgi:hypothetical protein
VKKDNLVEVSRKFAETLALLFYIMAKEVVDVYGEQGEKVVKRAMIKFGKTRGKAIRKLVESKGEPLSFENLKKYYDIPLGLIHDKQVVKDMQQDKYWREVYGCPLSKVWIKYGGERLGLLYCEQDRALIKGYNPKIKFSRKKNVLRGEGCCETILVL